MDSRIKTRRGTSNSSIKFILVNMQLNTPIFQTAQAANGPAVAPLNTANGVPVAHSVPATSGLSTAVATGARDAASDVPSAPAPAPAGFTAGFTAGSVVAADEDDPFIYDNTIDIHTDIAHPNFSHVCPPHPLDLVEPNDPPNTLYFVVTMGQPVDLHLQQQFISTRFTTWHGAARFYAEHFESGNVRLIPMNDISAPPGLQRHVEIRQATHTLPAPPAPALPVPPVPAPPAPPAPPSAAPAPSAPALPSAAPAPGSAANPIYVGTPDQDTSSQGPIIAATTPTPAPRTARMKGKGVFRSPLVYRPHRVAKLAETRVRRLKSSTATTVVQPTAAAAAAPPPTVTTAQPAATASVIQPVAQPTVTAAVAQPSATATTVQPAATAPVVRSVTQPAVTTVVAPPVVTSASDSVSQTSHSAAPNRVIDVSDIEMDDLPPQRKEVSVQTSQSTAPLRVIDVSDVEMDDLPPRRKPSKRPARDLNPQILVHDSDSDGPDFLPNYPRGQRGNDTSSTGSNVDPVTPSNNRLAAPHSATSTSTVEVPATTFSTPLPNEKPFKALFTDSDDGWLKSPLLSNKRYKLTPAARSLMGAPSSPLKNRSGSSTDRLLDRRFRLTSKGRSLHIPGADSSVSVAGPSSTSITAPLPAPANSDTNVGASRNDLPIANPLSTPIDNVSVTASLLAPANSDANVGVVHNDTPIAGPSSIPIDNASITPPLPAPANRDANVGVVHNNTDAENGDGRQDGRGDNESDGFGPWEFGPEHYDEIGEVMDAAWMNWPKKA
ncbi:hypothetical protein BDN70DRAFT_939021 [Pholiota conissans]|uniref:Uncharacterized protein n=1 Tax=Pholiota conissans TaxID=109636 RepID=A0A9P6CT89_9AGAR|nr:hypothetical protein BDN70DRAFT_939021 [Pholiota conissans]